MISPQEDEVLLAVRDLRTYYPLGAGRVIKAVEGLSFDLRRGETLGIVGESGSGKSTVSRSLIRLVDAPGYIAGGQLLWKGQDLMKWSESEMARLRGRDIGLIFQDPTTSLNPLLPVGWQLLETVRTHLDLPQDEARKRVLDTAAMVGIHDGEAIFHKYPVDYSAGFRQRVMIAMAIVCRPDLVLADEPTTMLGVTVQAQILDALRKLQREFGIAVILITHDFGVVSYMSDRIMVLYAGYVMEYASRQDFLLNPKHPYTVGLIGSVPLIEARRSRRLKVIPGFPPDMLKLSGGCPFAVRCSYVQALCRDTMPPLAEIAPQHWCACHFPVPAVDLELVEQLSMSGQPDDNLRDMHQEGTR
jgi:oligopeptide transport system ATP-binding protein